MTAPPRRSITVEFGDADEFDDRHASIELALALDPDSAHPYTQAQVLDAIRWWHGVVARVLVHLEATHLDKARRRHGCVHPRSDQYFECGAWGTDDFVAPYSLNGYCRPLTFVNVPREDAEQWRALIVQTLNDALTDDQLPALEPQPVVRHHHHGGGVPQEPTRTTTKEPSAHER